MIYMYLFGNPLPTCGGNFRGRGCPVLCVKDYGVQIYTVQISQRDMLLLSRVVLTTDG